jgi:hypothetical protein
MHRGYPAIKINSLRSFLSLNGVKRVARKCDTSRFASCRPAILQNRDDSRQRRDAVQLRIACMRICPVPEPSRQTAAIARTRRASPGLRTRARVSAGTPARWHRRMTWPSTARECPAPCAQPRPGRRAAPSSGTRASQSACRSSSRCDTRRRARAARRSRPWPAGAWWRNRSWRPTQPPARRKGACGSARDDHLPMTSGRILAGCRG